MRSKHSPKTYAFKKAYKRIAARCFDAAGYAIFFVIRRFSPCPKIALPQKILLIRLDHLGDAVMCRPALRALAKKYPEARIDLLAAEEVVPLFKSEPDIHTVIGMKPTWFSKAPWTEKLKHAKAILKTICQNRYDAAIDFRGDLRTILLLFWAGIPVRIGYGITGGGFLLTHEGNFNARLHQVRRNHHLLEFLDVFDRTFDMKPFTYSHSEKESTAKTLAPLIPAKRPRILIHPGAGYPSKRWNPARYEEIILRILHENLGSAILIGTNEERGLLSFNSDLGEDFCDLRGQTELEDLPILFDLCDLFIGNDSGPAHVAAAQNLPAVVLFSGTNNPDQWKPWGAHVDILNHPVPCSPCESRECPLVHHDCMEKLSVERVYQAMLEKIGKAHDS